MTTQELIAKLSKLDPNTSAVIYDKGRDTSYHIQDVHFSDEDFGEAGNEIAILIDSNAEVDDEYQEVTDADLPQAQPQLGVGDGSLEREGAPPDQPGF